MQLLDAGFGLAETGGGFLGSGVNGVHRRHHLLHRGGLLSDIQRDLLYVNRSAADGG